MRQVGLFIWTQKWLKIRLEGFFSGTAAALVWLEFGSAWNETFAVSEWQKAVFYWIFMMTAVAMALTVANVLPKKTILAFHFLFLHYSWASRGAGVGSFTIKHYRLTYIELLRNCLSFLQKNFSLFTDKFSEKLFVVNFSVILVVIMKKITEKFVRQFLRKTR